MINAILSWLYSAGKTIGADNFFRAIGPYGTLALAIVIGLIYVIGFFFIFIKTADDIRLPGLVRSLLNLIEIAIGVFIGYLFVTGNMGIIYRLGGL